MTASEGDGKRHELPVVYGPVTEKNIEQLRKLNTSIFPVNYDDKFYKDVLDSGEYTKLGRSLLPLQRSNDNAAHHRHRVSDRVCSLL